MKKWWKINIKFVEIEICGDGWWWFDLLSFEDEHIYSLFYIGYNDGWQFDFLFLRNFVLSLKEE